MRLYRAHAWNGLPVPVTTELALRSFLESWRNSCMDWASGTLSRLSYVFPVSLVHLSLWQSHCAAAVVKRVFSSVSWKVPVCHCHSVAPQEASSKEVVQLLSNSRHDSYTNRYILIIVTIFNNNNSVTGDPKEMAYLFQRLSVAYQRGNAVSFQSIFLPASPLFSST